MSLLSGKINESPQNESVGHVFWRFWLCCCFQRLLGKYLPKCLGLGLGHLCLTSSGARDLKPELASAGTGFFWRLRISITFLNWRFSKPLVGWISYPIIFSWFRNSDPVSLHEGWRGFLFGNLFVKIITNWKFLSISKTMLWRLHLV